MAHVDPPVSYNSGSRWGEAELDIYRFEKALKNHPFDDFPWQESFTRVDWDPIEDIVSILDDMFGPGAESRTSLNALEAMAFFIMLRDLTGDAMQQNIKNVPYTRSKPVEYSSPSLASAGTKQFNGSNVKDLSPEMPFTTPTPRDADRGVPGQDRLRRHPETTSPAFDMPEREPSPTTALVWRRGLKVPDVKSLRQ